MSNTTSSQVQVTWSLTHQHPDERAEFLTLKVQFSNGTIAQQFQLEGNVTQQMVDTVPGMEYRATMSASNQYGTRTTDPVPFWTQAGGKFALLNCHCTVHFLLRVHAPAGPGIPGHCPGYFESCILIWRGLDMRTRGHQPWQTKCDGLSC